MPALLPPPVPLPAVVPLPLVPVELPAVGATPPVLAVPPVTLALPAVVAVPPPGSTEEPPPLPLLLCWPALPLGPEPAPPPGPASVSTPQARAETARVVGRASDQQREAKRRARAAETGIPLGFLIPRFGVRIRTQRLRFSRRPFRCGVNFWRRVWAVGYRPTPAQLWRALADGASHHD